MEELEKKEKPAKKKAASRTSTKTTRKKTASDKADAGTVAATKPPTKKKATRTTRKKTSHKAPAEQDEVPSAAETQVADNENKESELMVNGLKFFSQLAQTLGDKEATARLVSSITEHDKKTGKTYLKVPVENEKTVEDAIMMLGTLFKALQ